MALAETAMPVTALTAAAMAAGLTVLSLRTSALRGHLGIALGDGGNPQMLAAIRRHGNAAEYVPLALLLMALAEYGGLGQGWMLAGAGALILGRILHPLGLGEGRPQALRIGGGILTTFTTLGMAAALTLQVLI